MLQELNRIEGDLNDTYRYLSRTLEAAHDIEADAFWSSEEEAEVLTEDLYAIWSAVRDFRHKAALLAGHVARKHEAVNS